MSKHARGGLSLGSKSDRELIELGRDIAGTQTELATKLGCSPRTVSVSKGEDEELPAEIRRRLKEYIHHGGKRSFADEALLAGRQPTAVPTGGSMHFRLTEAEREAFHALADPIGYMASLSEAVNDYLELYPNGLPAPTLLPEEAKVDVRIRIDIASLVRLNAALVSAGDRTLRHRNLYLRAALLAWVAKKTKPPKGSRHGRKTEGSGGSSAR